MALAPLIFVARTSRRYHLTLYSTFLKFEDCLKNWQVRQRVSLILFAPEGQTNRYIFEGECYLFYYSKLPFSEFTVAYHRWLSPRTHKCLSPNNLIAGKVL